MNVIDLFLIVSSTIYTSDKLLQFDSMAQKMISSKCKMFPNYTSDIQYLLDNTKK